jgi:hypothetical protein
MALTMTSRERLEAAWSHTVPDRVPVELTIADEVRDWPEARRIRDFVENQADNFLFVPAADWGFSGLPAERREEIIEERPGHFTRKRTTWRTAAGDFFAVTRHMADVLDAGDYQWERRFIDSLEDFERLTEAPRPPLRVCNDEYEAACARIGGRGLPIAVLEHALGTLVRRANTAEVFAWLLQEPALVHRFLGRVCDRQVEAIRRMGELGMKPNFITYAYEMLLPPWLGPRQFDEFVAPYDRRLHAAIHAIGGRMRAHCHGACFKVLTRLADLGVDSIEPLEPPPFGDTDLAAAKQLVGDRMLLSGNIPSQQFLRLQPDDVRDMVAAAVSAAAAGGGFTLCLTGHGFGPWDFGERSSAAAVIRNVEAYIDATLEFGEKMQS